MLNELPQGVLHGVLRLLQRERGGWMCCVIRGTCKLLQGEFDAINTCLDIRRRVSTQAAPVPPLALFLSLMQRTPRLSELAISPMLHVHGVSWTVLLAAADPKLRQQLTSLRLGTEWSTFGLEHPVSDLSILSACTGLQYLDLRHCSGLTSLQPLSAWDILH